MMRYTVTYTRAALDQLAEAWLEPSNRGPISKAADAIDRTLKIDAFSKGDEGPEGYRRLIVAPLAVLFTVEEEDRTATIWSVSILRD